MVLPSRPRQDCLTLPKGITSDEIKLAFTLTMPTSSIPTTRQTWERWRA